MAAVEEVQGSVVESPDIQDGASSHQEPVAVETAAVEVPGEHIREEIQGPNSQTPNAPEDASTIAPAAAAISPPRRPQTRSQTGTVPKRRTRDDSDHVVETKKRGPRKKPKLTPTVDADASSSHTRSTSSSPKPPPTREASLTSSVSSAPPSAPSTNPAERELTFYHSSIPDDQPQSRLPRSRASLPTPIPNLTKKSRGRRVPTKEVGTADPDQKDSRLYVCTVEGCGKCFHRGEHLKRHIRSIHTHEKPFKCTFPLCEKFFNRHDNLLQHLKVHRQTQFDDSANKSACTPAPSAERRQHSYSPASERSPSPPSLIPPPAAQSRTIYNAFPQPNTVPYPSFPPPMPIIYSSHMAVNSGSTEPPMSLIGNMAVSSLRTEVSSLRTEMPQSPTDMRGGGVPVGEYQRAY